MITQEELKQYLDYNKDTGMFTWIQKKAAWQKIGSVAGSLHHEGYIVIGFNYKPYPAHRLAWLFVYGKFPEKELDHINRIRTDNRIVNLREVTTQQNQFNLTKRQRTTSNYIGVSWNTSRQRYIAQIQVNKQKVYLGLFDNELDAHKAYQDAKARLHII